ncbi:MAG: hypothetical protein ACO36E_02870 [Synechocystis sp.]
MVKPYFGRVALLWVAVVVQVVVARIPTPAQTKITFEAYKQQCLVKIQSAGIQGKLAQDICNCTIATFKQQYSLEKFNQVVQKSKTDKAIAKQLADVGEACFEKYLYE